MLSNNVNNINIFIIRGEIGKTMLLQEKQREKLFQAHENVLFCFVMYAKLLMNF